MNTIECNFCKHTNLFDDSKIKISGKAMIITCEYCKRSQTVGFNNEKYYKEIIEKLK